MIRNLLPLILAGLMACSPAQEKRTVEPADRIFVNGRIYTLDDSQPWAEALAVRGDEIIYVGNSADASNLEGENTTVTDLDGRLLLPGFIETHMHIGDGLAQAEALKLTPEMSKPEALAAIGKYAASYPEQKLIFGSGFLAPAFGELGPTAADLDALIPNRRVFIIDEGFHSAWVNSKVLRELGIDKNTADPVPGSHYYKRYKNGDPTGWLVEKGAFQPVADALGVFNKERYESATSVLFPLLPSLGITAAFDAGNLMSEEVAVAVLEASRQQGILPLRVVASHYVNLQEQLPTAVEHVQKRHQQYHSELYDYRVLKLSLDGTVENKSALMLAPWEGQAQNTTRPQIPKAPTARVVMEAARVDMDVHMHALGDGAVRWALDMVEQVREEVAGSQSRFTMCHLQIVNPADVTRFAELNVVAQSTPSWYLYDDIALEFTGRERFEQMYPMRSIREAGARITFGSDYPAVWIGQDALNPLFNIEMAMTRQPPGDKTFAVQPPADERVTLEQAIRAYTLDAAWQLRLEEQVGSLQVGKQADLVVLSDNLFEMEPHSIHSAKALLTMMNGRVTYDAISETEE
ncbi:MAG: amidohydrolase [Halioglobus sp.]